MFLDPVDKKEVLTTINQCRNKTSEDHNNISMNLVEKYRQLCDSTLYLYL